MNNRRKAKLFAQCLDDIKNGILTQQECLTRYPNLRQELKTVFEIQNSFEKQEHFVLDASEIRLRKVSLMQKLPDRQGFVTKERHSRFNIQNIEWSSAMNWIIIVTTILSLMSTTGVAYASGDALPGEMLFPVKLLVENTRLWLASDNKDVEIIEDSLNRRIEEVGLLLENGSISNPDEITDIYQSRFDLLEKSLERIQARNPEEATRLRKELETRLQEQTRILENLLSGEKNSSNQMNHNTIQQMLEINQETHSRIKDEGTSGEQEMMDLAADVSNPNVEKNENNGQNNDQSNLDQGIGNGLKFSSQYLQDDRLKFEFQNEKNTIGDVYAQIDGNDYGCNQTGDKLTCDLSGSPGSGKLLILDAETNELIFSYQYQHEYAHLWEGLNEKAQDPKGQGNNDEQGLSDKGQSNHSNDGHDSQSNNKDKEK